MCEPSSRNGSTASPTFCLLASYPEAHTLHRSHQQERERRRHNQRSTSSGSLPRSEGANHSVNHGFTSKSLDFLLREGVYKLVSAHREASSMTMRCLGWVSKCMLTRVFLSQPNSPHTIFLGKFRQGVLPAPLKLSFLVSMCWFTSALYLKAI